MICNWIIYKVRATLCILQVYNLHINWATILELQFKYLTYQ